MPTRSIYKFLLLLVTITGFGVSLQAQEVVTLPRPDRITTTAPVERKSPMNSASMLTDKGYMRIIYSQPMLRGRQMLGKQVPYGKVWRAGANEATELFVTNDVQIGDQLLPAGAYSVFVIPEANNWTVIFNKDLGQWGAYGYQPDHDVLRVNAPVQQIDNPYEAFTTYFGDGKLIMAWGPNQVNLPLTFTEG